MSDEAIADGQNTPHTAFEFRKEFKKYGIKYNRFFCPECGTRVFPVVIYRLEIKNNRAPCFRVSGKQPHEKSCPYHADKSTVKSEDPIRHFEEGNVDMPAALIPPRKRYEGTANTCLSNTETGTIGNSGASLGTAIARTSSIGPIVDFWYRNRNAIVYDNIFKINQWNERWDRLRKELKTINLKLYNWDTNYANAFNDVYWCPDSAYPKIYYGKATVHKKGDGFTLIPQKSCIDRNGTSHDAVIDIVDTCFQEKDYKGQRALHDFLKDFSDTGTLIEWFVFGRFELKGDHYHLCNRSIRHMKFFELSR